MKSKLILLVGAGVGYVLGTKAGRQRYEQLRTQAKHLMENPKVQDMSHRAQEFAAEKAPEVQHKVSEAASKVTHAAGGKLGRHTDGDSSISTAGTAGPATGPGAGPTEDLVNEGETYPRATTPRDFTPE